MDKSYDHKKVEDKIYKKWEASGAFKPEINPSGEPYSISLPPPNVTGNLHMGHAYEDTLQDILVRFQRMRGKKALWVPGTDHAAIATQAKVEEKMYKKDKKTRHDLGREKFVENVVVATRHILFWSLPVVVLFIVLRAQIVRTILGTGEFGWAETRLTAAALALFAVSLVAQSIVLLFVRGYYAAGNTMKPLLVNILSAGGIVVSAYLFINIFEASQFFRDFIDNCLSFIWFKWSCWIK